MEEKLKQLLKNQSRLFYVDHMEREGLAMFVDALDLGLEGIVAKEPALPYVEGPRKTSVWLKIKDKNYERKKTIEFHKRQRLS